MNNINSNICEQVFSWLRNFAPMLNEMRPSRHLFCLLMIAKRHNLAIQTGKTGYLHPTRRPNPAYVKPYGCSGMKVMKDMKGAKGKKVKKIMKGIKVMKGMKTKVMKNMK